MYVTYLQFYQIVFSFRTKYKLGQQHSSMMHGCLHSVRGRDMNFVKTRLSLRQ